MPPPPPPTTTVGLPPPLPLSSGNAAAPMSMPVQQTSSSRARPQQRRKPNDDAAYLGPSQGSANAKRQAPDRAEGDRAKRKRVDNGRRIERVVDGDVKESLVKFTNMPIAAIYRYLAHFDLIPIIYPSPLTSIDLPPPVALEHLSGRAVSPTPSLSATTPANRPRRELKEQSRRRSTRLVEDEFRGRPPVVADVDDAHRILAGIAERHFVDQVRREEVDILASFMCKVKSQAKGAPGQPACARRAARY